MLHDKNDTLSTKQFAIMVFVAGTAGKLFSLPAVFVKSGGRSAWAALAICLAVDLAMLGMFLIASRIGGDKTAFELIEERCGKIVAKAVFLFALAYLLYKTLSLVLTVSEFGGRELFMGMPPVVTLLPLAVLLCAFGAGSFRSLGRTAEILIYFIAAALICLILLTHKSADMIKVLPPFGEGSLSAPLLRFPFLACGDFTALYLVLGRIKKGKGFSWAVSGAGVLSALAVLAFSVLSFAALMNLRAITPDSAVTMVTRTSTSRLAFGRVDKIVFAVFAAAPVLTAGFFFRSAVLSAQFVLGAEKPAVLSVTLSALVFMAALTAGKVLISDFSGRFGVYFAPPFFIGIPLILLILSFMKRKNAHEESK